VVCLCLQLQQLFPDPQEWESIQALMAAAQLVRQGGALASSSGSPPHSRSSSSEAGDSAADDVPWGRVYAHQHARACLMVLSCWMPDALAAGFMRLHLVSSSRGGGRGGGGSCLLPQCRSLGRRGGVCSWGVRRGL